MPTDEPSPCSKASPSPTGVLETSIHKASHLITLHKLKTSLHEAKAEPPADDYSLQHTWALWYDSGTAHSGKKSVESWNQRLGKVSAFHSVAGFWRLFNHIRGPTSQKESTDIHIFKEGLQPAWESCLSGGTWLLTTKRGPDSNKHITAKLDKMWDYLAMHCIGDQFEADDESADICGISSVLRKREHRLCLWTKSGSDRLLQMRIGRQLSSLLHKVAVDGVKVRELPHLEYRLHVVAMAGAKNSQYTA
ncbi:hypothetical protein WJX73_002965 [Symbiochloris irregularis]|uniref:mRNA cap-binding protein n=1 Tax=Symbiochloris irregularis TaxID=706552 RepID=A0AAW1NV72_9CHLO